MIDDAARHQAHIFFRLDFALERTGNGAHAATGHAGIGEQRGEHGREQVRVLHPRRIPPVGQVNVLLHALTVERAVGKAVDGGHVIAAITKERAEFFECLTPSSELAGGTRRESKTHGKRPGVRELLTDDRQCRAQGRANLAPAFSGMNVRAVRQIEASANPHRPTLAGRSAARSWIAAMMAGSSIDVTSKLWPTSRSSVMWSSPPRCSRNSRNPRISVSVPSA